MGASPAAEFGHGLPPVDDGTGQWRFGVRKRELGHDGLGHRRLGGGRTGNRRLGEVGSQSAAACCYESPEAYTGYEHTGYETGARGPAGGRQPQQPRTAARLSAPLLEDHEGYDS